MDPNGTTSRFLIGNDSLSMKYFRQAAWYVAWKKWGSGSFWLNSILMMLTIGAPMLLIQLLPAMLYRTHIDVNLMYRLWGIVLIIIGFIGLWLGVGSIKSMMETAKNPDYKKTCFHYYNGKQAWKALLIILLIGIFIWGLIFLGNWLISFAFKYLPFQYRMRGEIIVGIIWGIIEAYLSFRLYFSLYALAEHNCSPWKAITRSWKITKGHFWNYVWFNIYFGFFNVLWALCLGLGLVRTIPMQGFASIYYYYQLSQLYDKTSNTEQYPITVNNGQKTSNVMGVLGVILGILIQLWWLGTIALNVIVYGSSRNRSVTKNFSAQDVARDTQRQLDIRDILAWIAGYYSLNGKRPWNNISGDCNNLRENLVVESNLMSSLPQEPDEWNVLHIGKKGTNRDVTLIGGYYYEYIKRQKRDKAWLLLVAKMETPQKSNYPCSKLIEDDIVDVKPCQMLGLKKDNNSEIPPECIVEDASDYCYVLTY